MERQVLTIVKSRLRTTSRDIARELSITVNYGSTLLWRLYRKGKLEREVGYLPLTSCGPAGGQRYYIYRSPVRLGGKGKAADGGTNT